MTLSQLQAKNAKAYLDDLNSAATQKWYGRPVRTGESMGMVETLAQTAKAEGVTVGSLGIRVGRVQMTDGQLAGLDIERTR